jgi:hypothetical protein
MWGLCSVELSRRSMETCTPTLPHWKHVRSMSHTSAVVDTLWARRSPDHRITNRLPESSTANRVGVTGNEVNMTRKSGTIVGKKILGMSTSTGKSACRIGQGWELKMSKKNGVNSECGVDCLLSNYIMFEITSCTTSTTARSIIPKN